MYAPARPLHAGAPLSELRVLNAARDTTPNWPKRTKWTTPAHLSWQFWCEGDVVLSRAVTDEGWWHEKGTAVNKTALAAFCAALRACSRGLFGQFGWRYSWRAPRFPGILILYFVWLKKSIMKRLRLCIESKSMGHNPYRNRAY